MFKKSRTTRIVFFGILFLVIAATVATFVYFNPFRTAQAAPLLDETYLDPLNPDVAWRSCTIGDIYVVDDHIHVRCTTDIPLGVFYYSYYGDDAHSIMANRFLMLLNTALALGKDIDFRYSTSLLNVQPWCPISNCRRLIDMWLNQ